VVTATIRVFVAIASLMPLSATLFDDASESLIMFATLSAVVLLAPALTGGFQPLPPPEWELKKLTTFPSPRDRAAGAAALRKYDWRCRPDLIDALVNALSCDPSAKVREEAAESLACLAPPSPVAEAALRRAAACDSNLCVRLKSRKGAKAVAASLARSGPIVVTTSRRVELAPAAPPALYDFGMPQGPGIAPVPPGFSDPVFVPPPPLGVVPGTVYPMTGRGPTQFDTQARVLDRPAPLNRRVDPRPVRDLPPEFYDDPLTGAPGAAPRRAIPTPTRFLTTPPPSALLPNPLPPDEIPALLPPRYGP